MSVDIRSINDHLLADEKAREQISQLSKDVYDSINESTNALLNDVSVKKFSTGCPIVIEDPIANVAFASVKQKFTPKQEGSGDPYPLGGAPNQLCLMPNLETTTYNGITFSCSNGVVKIKGTATSTATLAGSYGYTLPAGISGTFFISGSRDGCAVYAKVTMPDGTNKWNSNKSFTLDGTETEVTVYIQIEKGTTVDTTICPMLNAGTSALPWEPPSNIRPIVPYTELEMTRAGKNLLDISKSTVNNGKFGEDGVFSANDKDTASRLDFKLQFYRESKIADTKYIFGATNNQRCTFNAVIPDGCTRIRFANNGSTAEFTIIMTDFLKAGATFSFSFDVLDATVGACKLSNFQLELGSTATPYEPFIAADTYTDTLDEPMYGGERDWVKGELVDEWGFTTVSHMDFNGKSAGVVLMETTPSNAKDRTLVVCDTFPSAIYGQDVLKNKACIYTRGRLFVGLSYDLIGISTDVSNSVAADAANLWLSEHPLQIAYQLATPTTTQRTPQRITTIPGTNTVFGDGEFEIEWFKSTKKIAEERENLLLESFTDPLEAEGNPLVIKPVGGLPFDSVVTKFTPKQEGSGDPYPAGGGKNLLKVTATTQTVSGVTFTVNADGTIVANGTATAQIYFKFVDKTPIPAGSYLFNGCVGGNDTTYYMYIYSYGDGHYYGTNSKDAQFAPNADAEIIANIYINTGITMNNVTFYPMLRLATETDATYAPYSNIRPIVPWTELSTTRAGKNLISEVSKDASKGFLWGNKNSPIALKAGRTYVLSTSNNAGTKAGGLYFVDSAGGGSTADEYILSYAYNVSEHRYTPEKDVDCMFLVYYASGALDGATIQLELGSTATSYEPYTADTYTDTLDEPMYGGERDWVKGKLGKTYFFIELTGEENWVASSAANAYIIGRNLNSTIIPDNFECTNIGYETPYHACSHYKVAIYSDNIQSGSVDVFNGANGRSIRFKDDRFTTVDAWKAFVAEQKAAGTPVQFCGKHITPVTTQRTAHDIPALVGVNTLYGDGDSITVKGRQSKTIDLEERIAALEAAVLLS